MQWCCLSENKKLSRFNHPQIQHVRQLLASKSYRTTHREFVMEHKGRIEDLIHSQSPLLSGVFFLAGSAQEFEQCPCPTYAVDRGIWSRLSSLACAQDCLAVVRQPSFVLPSALRRLLVVDGVRLPSNLGAMIRTGVAFGWEAIVTLPHTVDPFHPESVRASAGYVSDIAIVEDTWDRICTTYPEMQWVALTPHATHRLLSFRPDQQRGIGLIVGSESQGIDPDIFATSVSIASLKIDTSRVESLNVAVGVGIALHHLSHIFP